MSARPAHGRARKAPVPWICALPPSAARARNVLSSMGCTPPLRRCCAVTSTPSGQSLCKGNLAVLIRIHLGEQARQRFFGCIVDEARCLLNLSLQLTRAHALFNRPRVRLTQLCGLQRGLRDRQELRAEVEARMAADARLETEIGAAAVARQESADAVAQVKAMQDESAKASQSAERDSVARVAASNARLHEVLQVFQRTKRSMAQRCRS